MKRYWQRFGNGRAAARLGTSTCDQTVLRAPLALLLQDVDMRTQHGLITCRRAHILSVILLYRVCCMSVVECAQSHNKFPRTYYVLCTMCVTRCVPQGAADSPGTDRTDWHRRQAATALALAYLESAAAAAGSASCMPSERSR